jgi:hypothetical protein
MVAGSVTFCWRHRSRQQRPLNNSSFRKRVKVHAPAASPGPVEGFARLTLQLFSWGKQSAQPVVVTGSAGLETINALL